MSHAGFYLSLPVQAMQTIWSSGLVVSGNTAILVSDQMTSGDMFNSWKVSGYTESIQIYRGTPSATMPTLGPGHQGTVAEYVVEDIVIRRATYDVSGGNNQAFGILQTRVQDSFFTCASGVWNSGFNLPEPSIVSVTMPMPSELFARAKMVWRFRYLL